MIKDINNIDTILLEEDDRIVAYLKGKMSAEEEKLFLKELNDNPELKEKAVITARLVKGLKKVGAEQDKDTIGAFMASSEQYIEAVAEQATQIDNSSSIEVENATRIEKASVRLAKLFGIEITEGINQMEATAIILERLASGFEHASSSAAAMAGISKDDTANIKSKNAKTVSIRKASTWLSIAASLIFIVWIGFEYKDYRYTTGLGEEFGNAISSSMIARGVDTHTEAEKKLMSLFANVKSGDNLDNAIHELSLCWELSTMDTYNDYTNFSAEIGWNLAIAYLKDNNKRDAKIVLENLIVTSEEGSAIYNSSKQLLEKIVN